MKNNIFDQFALNIEELAAIKSLRTNELYTSNDLYGHAYVLKKYAKVDPNYRIKAVLEHSALLYDHIWRSDIITPLPAIFTFGEYRFSYLKQFTNKALFAIGPSIHYAKPIIAPQRLNKIKKELGKTLLVFLPHSAWSIYTYFNAKEVIANIKKVEKEFNNILICLGWRDVLRGLDAPYPKEGYICVTAGHVYDFAFLERLKTIILLSTHTMSFSFGTHLGFCIHLNKPHWIFPLKQKIEYPKNLPKGALYKSSNINWGNINDIIACFKDPSDDIKPNQKEIVDLIWGSPFVKSSNQLKELFDITEDMFNCGFISQNKEVPIMLYQLFDYLENKNIKLSKILLNYAKRLGFKKEWIKFVQFLISIIEKKFKNAEKIANFLKKSESLFLREKVQKLLKETNFKNTTNFSVKNELLSLFPRPVFYSLPKSNFPWNKK